MYYCSHNFAKAINNEGHRSPRRSHRVNPRLSPLRPRSSAALLRLDLFAPKKDQNNYGARNQKNLAVGKITEKSYIPAGLTKAQYEKARAADEEKKKARYAKNVAKAGSFRITLPSIKSAELISPMHGPRPQPGDTTWPRQSTTGLDKPTKPSCGPRKPRSLANRPVKLLSKQCVGNNSGHLLT
jgi:hypothetical protein